MLSESFVRRSSLLLRALTLAAFALAPAASAWARHLSVHLKTTPAGRIVVAENGGGGAVNANRRAASTWETFTLIVNEAAPPPLKLSGPFNLPQAILPNPVGVDFSPLPNSNNLLCTNPFLGLNFPNCYSGHPGSDLILAGGFLAMDAGSIEVTAAGPGYVVTIEKDRYDRCHFVPASPDAPHSQYVVCPGAPNGEMEANFVAVLQDDGLVAYYFHLKQGSIPVQPGDRVACGQPLGRVGSSGMSSTPHLHFELRDLKCVRKFPDIGGFKGRPGVTVDPYSLNLWREMWPGPGARIPKKVCDHPSAPSHPAQERATVQRARSVRAAERLRQWDVPRPQPAARRGVRC